MADKNYLSFANEVGLGNVQELGQLLPPAEFADGSDTLKLSNCLGLKLHATAIYGLKEDCVDINRGRNLEVACDLFVPRGKYVATVKGGADQVTLRGVIQGHGSETDIDIGNWSDQGSDRTKHVYLDLKTTDGSPVKVRVLHGWVPVFLNQQVYDVDKRAKGIFWYVMWALKKLRLA